MISKQHTISFVQLLLFFCRPSLMDDLKLEHNGEYYDGDSDQDEEGEGEAP
jgi:hypothetical protein